MNTTAATEPTSRRAAVGLLVSLGVCFAASALGGLATASSVSSWYPELVKPSWTPSDRVFAPVWTALYAAMALAAWLVWRSGRPARVALIAFGIQLALNVLWSVLFFGLRSPGAALVEIAVLLVAVWVTIALFWPRSRAAAALMVPYGLWVGFAAALNASIWRLNG